MTLEKLNKGNDNFSVYNKSCVTAISRLLVSRLSQKQSGQYVNPFKHDKFYSSKLKKEFADDNFKFDKDGRKFSKWVENTDGKGEIARNEQILLFPQCFEKTCTADM